MMLPEDEELLRLAPPEPEGPAPVQPPPVKPTDTEEEQADLSFLDAAAEQGRALVAAPEPTPVAAPQATDPETAPVVARRAAAPSTANVRPYGMEAPPEAKRDRLGEAARLLLGMFAGRDKYAKRGALAEGLSTMLSSQPQQEVDKENYDRRLKAAQLANARDPNYVSPYHAALISKFANDARLGSEGLNLRKRQAERLEGEQMRKWGTDNPAAAAMAESLYVAGVPAEMLRSQDGRLKSYQELLDLRPIYTQQTDLYKMPAETEHLADRTRRVEQAKVDVDVANEGQTTPMAARKAGAVAAAQAPYNYDRSFNSARGTEDATGARFQQAANKFRDETESTRKQVVVAVDLDRILSQFKNGDIPGAGMWDSWKSGKISSEADLTVRNAVRNMMDLVARGRSGMQITDREYARLSEFVAAGDGATEKQFLTAWNAYRKQLQAEMQQQSVGREDVARQIMGTHADWFLPRSAKTQPRAAQGPLRAAPAPAAGAVAPARSTAPGAVPSGTPADVPTNPMGGQDVLPTTGQRRGEVPKVPGATPPAPRKFAGYIAVRNTDGTLTITGTDGRTKTAPGSFEAAFVAGGGVMR